MFDQQIFCNSLKNIRNQCGLTQEQLAEKCYCTQTYISQIERGVSLPSIPVLVSISEALNVSTDQLLTGTTPDASLLPAKNDEEIRHLCHELTNIFIKLFS